MDDVQEEFPLDSIPGTLTFPIGFIEAGVDIRIDTYQTSIDTRTE
jgi:hypothetical protein